MEEIKMKWTGGLRFEDTDRWGHKIVTDGGKKAGGNESGHKPTDLLLYSIAGCTGIDVVKILEKQRQKVTGFEIEIKAHQGEEFPKPFHKIEIKYIFEGENLDEKKIARAIELSEDKYCTSSLTAKMKSEVVSKFEIK